MRAVLQRVSSARVRVDGTVIGEIGIGLVAFIGVAQDDGAPDVAWLAGKIRDVRVFGDDAGKMNRALAETGGSVLAISQFTLYGDCRKGRRPSLDAAAGPDIGRALFAGVVRELRASGLHVETGVFQAHMEVELVNDGPITLLLDSRRTF